MNCYKKTIVQIVLFSFFSFPLFSETWNVDADGNWGNSQNWNPASVPNSNVATADFNTAIMAPRTVTLNGTFSAAVLSFQNAQPYTLSSGTLNLHSSFNVLAPIGNHVINSDLVFQSSIIANIPPGATFTINGNISGNNTLSKNGAGTLILNGVNSYSGSTIVNNGTLEGTTDGIQGGFQNNSTVCFNQTIPTGTFGNIIAGNGTIQKKGTGTVIFAGTVGLPVEIQLLDGIIQTNNVSSTLNTGLLRFNGGTLQITAMDSPSNNVNLDGDGTFNINNCITVDLTGTVGGNGKLLKSGCGFLDLGPNIHNYLGGTQIDEGTLKINVGGNLGAGPITFNGGTLNPTTTLTLPQNGNMLVDGTVDVSTGTTTWNGLVSGNGGLIKTGNGTLLLTAANSYKGRTLVSQGTLEGTTTSLQGNITNNATVNFNQGSTGSYAGNLSGSGLVEINGGGTVTFGGTNSYTGGTNITSGTLIGTTTSLQGSITNSDTITFNQNFDGNFNGFLSGTGTLLKSGSGTTAFSGTHPMSGLSTINGGTLSLNGTLGGDVQVDSGAIFSGNATVNNLTNNGTVSPGNSIGVINVLGNYTQGGNLIIEVDQNGNNDVLNVTGTANLGGTLTADPLPGLYSGEEIYTFLRAGTVNPGFVRVVSTANATPSVQYFATFAQLDLNFRGSILPIPIDDLPSNAKSVAKYLFCGDFYPDDADLKSVMQQLLTLPPNLFIKELDQLSPDQFGALPLTDLQNNRMIANTITSKTENFSWCDQCETEKNCQNKENLTAVWLAPVGQWQKQRGYKEQLGFNTQTYGFSMGGSHLFSSWIYFSGGLGYTHTNIEWKDNAGEGDWNSIYLSPSVGLLKKNWYINFLTQGSVNFYSINRDIRFTGLHRTAHNSHRSFGLLARVDGGYKFTFYRPESQLPLTILPTARLSYFNLFEESYKETGAKSINLKVSSKYSSYLQPEFLLKFLREIHIDTLCITPIFHLGWVGNYPITSGTYTSRFAIKESFCKSSFSVDSYDKNTNQLSIGTALLIKQFEQWQVEISYEARLLDRLFINNATINADWKF